MFLGNAYHMINWGALPAEKLNAVEEGISWYWCESLLCSWFALNIVCGTSRLMIITFPKFGQVANGTLIRSSNLISYLLAGFYLKTTATMQIMCSWAFCDERAILWFHTHTRGIAKARCLTRWYTMENCKWVRVRETAMSKKFCTFTRLCTCGIFIRIGFRLHADGIVCVFSVSPIELWTMLLVSINL